MPKAWKNTGRRWSAKHGTPAKHTSNNGTPRGWRTYYQVFPSYLRHSVYLYAHSRGSATLHHLPVFFRPFRTYQAMNGYKRCPAFFFTAIENPDLQVMCRSGFLSFREICRCSVGEGIKAPWWSGGWDLVCQAGGISMPVPLDGRRKEAVAGVGHAPIAPDA